MKRMIQMIGGLGALALLSGCGTGTQASRQISQPKSQAATTTRSRVQTPTYYFDSVPLNKHDWIRRAITLYGMTLKVPIPKSWLSELTSQSHYRGQTTSTGQTWSPSWNTIQSIDITIFSNQPNPDNPDPTSNTVKLPGTINGPFPHSYILPAQGPVHNSPYWSDDMVIQLPQGFSADIHVTSLNKTTIATVFNETEMILPHHT